MRLKTKQILKTHFFDQYLSFQEGDCEKNEQGRFSAKLFFFRFWKNIAFKLRLNYYRNSARIQKSRKIQKLLIFKKFFRGHINILKPTKFRYWLSLQVLNVYFMLEGPLNELCKRLRSIGICKFPLFSAYETFKGQNHLIN